MVSIAFLVVGGMYLFYQFNHSTATTVVATLDGIIIDQRGLLWESIEGYYFLYGPSKQQLHLLLSGGTELVLQMGEYPPDWFRTRLSEQSIAEVQHTDSFVDVLLRFFYL